MQENVRNFEEDLRNSNNLTLRKNWGNVFKQKFGNDCIVKWKDDINMQKELGMDTIIETKEGRRYSIEVKTRNYNCYKNPSWLMEIVSHIYDQKEQPRKLLYSKSGWIYTTTAEYVFHGTLNQDGTDIVESIFYSLNPFKTEKYKGEFGKYDKLWLPTLFSNGNFQLTLNKLIPLEVIKKDSIEFWELEEQNGRA